jgi:HSP20 family protein
VAEIALDQCAVGAVERDKIAADFAKGVLSITLPKTAEAQKQPKKIDVKSG